MGIIYNLPLCHDFPLSFFIIIFCTWIVEIGRYVVPHSSPNIANSIWGPFKYYVHQMFYPSPSGMQSMMN